MQYQDNFDNDNFEDLDIPDDMFEDAEDKKETPVKDSLADTNNKKVKNKKIKASKKEESTTTEAEEAPKKVDCTLYVITDKITPGLIGYMRSCGLNVTNIFDNIETVRNILLMKFEQTRIAVIDSGTGKFITPTIRKELIDMIGVNDENTKFTIFYTDSILKSDSMAELGKAGKEIEWVRYQSTPVFVASMLCHNENYIIDATTQYIEKGIEDNILGYIGDSPKGCTLEKMSPPSIQASSIAKNIASEDTESIQKFDIKY